MKPLLKMALLTALSFCFIAPVEIKAQAVPLVVYAIKVDPQSGSACTAFNVFQANVNNGKLWSCPNDSKIWTQVTNGPGTGVTSVTAATPLTGGAITTVGTIGCQGASASQSGCLSSTDWNAFNLKQTALPTVVKFGADPTGSTDSSTAFNAALTSNGANGVSAFMPCGTYLLNSAVTLNLPTQSLVGENEGCVHIVLGSQASGIIQNMSPFTTNPAGELANFTLTCSASTTYGIDSGQLVGAWWHNIDVSGCNKAGAAAIHIHAIGSFTTWAERNHFGPQVSTGGVGSLRNTHGFLLDADNIGDSFGYNNFEDIKVNVSTGQEGFTLASGFMYNLPQMNMVCNMDNNLAGSVGPICIRSSSNWDSNLVQLHGEYQASGSGSGTPYRFQVDIGGRFSNLKGSNIDVLSPGGSQVSDNVLPAATSSPNVTLVQGSSVTSWDTGTFTLNGISTKPQPIQRGNYGSLGLLIGANIESPYLSLFQGTGNKFQFLTVPTNGTIGGDGIDIGGVGEFGDYHGAFWIGQCNSLVTNCHAPGSIDGQVHASMAGFDSTHRSGYNNIFLTTATGINESMSGDQNYSGGWGFREGSNVAHPLAWGYTLDPTDFEVCEKTFQTPLSNCVMTISHGGSLVPKGHLNQLGTNNIGGTCTLSSSTSCTFTFTDAFVNKPICTHGLEFDVAGAATYHVTPSTSGCTITFSIAQTGTVDLIAVGNPN